MPSQPVYRGAEGLEAVMYANFNAIWKITGAKEWLRDSEPVLKLKPCFAIEGGRVEETLGEWRICKCAQAFYCSRVCQARDWKVGMHRTVYKDIHARARMIEMKRNVVYLLLLVLVLYLFWVGLQRQ